MIALYQSVVGMAFILLMTMRTPFFFPGRGLFDPCVLLTLYLAFFRPVREGAIFACALGIAMDSLSAGPIGLYFVVYLFLFTVFRLAPMYLEVKNALFLTFSAALAMLVEELMLSFSAMASGADITAVSGFFPHMFLSSLYTGALGYPVISCLRGGNDKISAWQAGRRAKA